MAEHWISAAAARDIVAQPRSPAAGTRALCERAYAALVKTKARLFTVKNLGRRQENVEVPAAFWWAGGHEALTQDWTTGDFSTWINNNEQWQAFGVTFALSGVLEMLPFEQRAVTARRLSVAGSPAWMPARAALRFARKEGGIDAAWAKKAILEQAHLGFVTGRAVLAQRFDGPILSRDPSWEGREWDVPDWFWRGSTVKDHSRQDWESGWFSAEGPGPSGDCLMNLTGVYFLTESLQVLALAKHDEPREVATKARAGGQPPRAFWDELLCDIWGLLHQGDFKPERQSDVERAMLIWAEQKGEKLSEATARPKASLVFKVFKGEAKNFLAD